MDLVDVTIACVLSVRWLGQCRDRISQVYTQLFYRITAAVYFLALTEDNLVDPQHKAVAEDELKKRERECVRLLFALFFSMCRLTRKEPLNRFRHHVQKRNGEEDPASEGIHQAQQFAVLVE